jgi:hypothetical protein
MQRYPKVDPQERMAAGGMKETRSQNESDYNSSRISNKMDLPQIQIPRGGGAIRGIDEKFEVNSVNGTIDLDIPLPLSQGRTGFMPAVELNYKKWNGRFCICLVNKYS